MGLGDSSLLCNMSLVESRQRAFRIYYSDHKRLQIWSVKRTRNPLVRRKHFTFILVLIQFYPFVVW